MVPVYAAALIIGFPMAGMSASFGGWPPALAFVGAVAGGIGMIVVARVFGPDTP
jgi:hypothetical protein